MSGTIGDARKRQNPEPSLEARTIMAEAVLETWVAQCRAAEATRDRLHGQLLQANAEIARLTALMSPGALGAA